jgi:hypothetical protein
MIKFEFFFQVSLKFPINLKLQRKAPVYVFVMNAGPGSNKVTQVSLRPSDNFSVKNEVQLKEEIISASLVEVDNKIKLWVLGKKRHKAGEPAFPNVVSEFLVAQSSNGSSNNNDGSPSETYRIKETNRHGMAVACTAIHGSTRWSDNFFVANASDR